MKTRWLLGLIFMLSCASGEGRGLQARAMRELWVRELEVLEAAAPAHSECHVVDLERVRAAAQALDAVSKLDVEHQIHREYVQLDRTELQAAIRRWEVWFTDHHRELDVERFITVMEEARKPRPPEVP